MKKSSWINRLTELFIVTLGILIAFGLNNWNEGRKERKLVKLYIEGLKHEMISNRDSLLVYQQYHLDLMKSLTIRPEETVLSLGYYDYHETAWKLADNDVFKQNIDHKLYQQLVSTYKDQFLMEKHAANASERVHEINVMSPFYNRIGYGKLTPEQEKELQVQLKQGWIPVYQDWTNFEKKYLSSLEKSIEMIGDY